MHRVHGVLVLFALLGAVGCSDSGSRDADVLDGVSEAVAERLCTDFFAAADGMRRARDTFTLEQMDVAVDGYEKLGADARRSGAKAFARELSDAADAARELARSAKGATVTGSGGSSGSSAEQAAPMASVLARVVRLQLPESRLSLACYSRGYVAFKG